MVLQLYCFLQDASPSLPHTSHPLLVDPVEIVHVEQVGPPAALAILGQLQYLRALQHYSVKTCQTAEGACLNTSCEELQESCVEADDNGVKTSQSEKQRDQGNV